MWRLGLIVLLVAVSHADALQAVSGLDGRRGFLHRQPVVDGLVALVVQCAVQDALQPEVPVGLLLIWGGRKEKQQSVMSVQGAGGSGCRLD